MKTRRSLLLTCWHCWFHGVVKRKKKLKMKKKSGKKNERGNERSCKNTVREIQYQIERYAREGIEGYRFSFHMFHIILQFSNNEKQNGDGNRTVKTINNIKRQNETRERRSSK